MKLLALFGLAAAVSAMPQQFSSGPLAEDVVDRFFDYAKSYQMIFANEANWPRLQQLFSGPQFAQLSYSAEQWQGLYERLAALWERFGMEAPIPEEWRTTDVNKDGQIESTEIYATLRDTVSRKMFLALFSFFYQSATERLPGPFWTPAKKNAFEQGGWGQILRMPEISGPAMEKLANDVAAEQGPLEAEKFKIGMGMGSEAEGESIPVQTSNGRGTVQLPVKPAGTPSQEPFVADDQPILTKTGQSVPAGEVVKTGASLVEGGNVMVTMPNGNQVPMAAGSEDEIEEEEQKLATIQSNADGAVVKMPVVSTSSDEATGTATTTILTVDGDTMEVTMAQPEADSSLSGVQGDETDSAAKEAEIKETVSNAIVDGLAFPAKIAASALNVDNEEAIAEACGEEDKCKAMVVQTSSMSMILPVETKPSTDSDETGIKTEMKVENPFTGEATTLSDVVIQETPQGTIRATGSASDGSKMDVEFPAPQPDGLSADEAIEGSEGIMTIESPTGQPLATANINRITSTKKADGAQEIKIEGTVNANPTVVTITTKEAPEAPAAPADLAADEITSAKMVLSVEGAPKEELKVVEQTEEKVSGVMTDGSILIVPAPKVATTTDFAGDNDEIKLLSPNGQEMRIQMDSVQTSADKSAEQLTAKTPNGAGLTVTVTGM